MPILFQARFLDDELLFKIEFTHDIRLMIHAFQLYHKHADSSPKRALIVNTLQRKISEHLDTAESVPLSDLIQLVGGFGFFATSPLTSCPLMFRSN